MIWYTICYVWFVLLFVIGAERLNAVFSATFSYHILHYYYSKFSFFFFFHLYPRFPPSSMIIQKMIYFKYMLLIHFFELLLLYLYIYNVVLKNEFYCQVWCLRTDFLFNFFSLVIIIYNFLYVFNQHFSSIHPIVISFEINNRFKYEGKHKCEVDE